MIRDKETPPQNEAERRQSDREQRAFTDQDMLRFRTGPGVEPDKVPPRQPGDGWIILGLLLGSFAGLAGGWAVAESIGLNPFVGAVAGALVGAIAGILIGDLVKKTIARRRRS